jgi:RNA polymerase sigma-70 factor (ECF subfamily)
MTELLEAARAGSNEALGRVLQTCREYLLLVANEEEGPELKVKAGASDLVQETFLEAQRDFGRFQGSSERELLAWLRRLLLNNLANLRRRYQTQSRQHVREVRLETVDGLCLLLSDASTPSGRAIRREEIEALERVLGEFPAHYQEVISLRHRERLSFEEIGRRMGRSPDAARMLWWRAFERLAEQLRGFE